MTERDFLAEAKAQIEAETAARQEGEIATRAAGLAWQAEREATHVRLCRKHGLNPAVTSPRQLADAERAYAAAWTSFVASRFGSSARTGHVLDPHSAGFKNPDDIETHLALRDRLAEQFARTWPPSDLRERIGAGVTDGTQAHYGHAA